MIHIFMITNDFIWWDFSGWNSMRDTKNVNTYFSWSLVIYLNILIYSPVSCFYVYYLLFSIYTCINSSKSHNSSFLSVGSFTITNCKYLFEKIHTKTTTILIIYTNTSHYSIKWIYNYTIIIQCESQMLSGIL